VQLHARKDELLLVPDRPEIPLHTNGSENDLRAHVTKRKISGGTWSESGRDARDAFLGLLKTCRKLGLSFFDYLVPTAVCTIYDGQFPDPKRQRLLATALTLFNDVITREAFALSLAVLDLRLVCSEATDYANPIEPSIQGGAKIAQAIKAFVTSGLERKQGRSEVFS
jgi:hypothetical protein